MIGKEQALDICATKYDAYRRKADETFATDGAAFIGNANYAHYMATRYQEIAGLNNTDEAVAQIRERLKRKQP